MSGPLHERIRADFEGRILRGELAPGARLPTEAELMQIYGCSRMTVHRSLASLAETGLVERRKRGGTIVARPRALSMVLDVPDLPEVIRERGQSYAWRLESRAATQSRLDLCGVHFADGRPFAAEQRSVNLAAVPGIAQADFTASPPGSWLLRHVPWTEAETRINAVAADADDARLLAIAPGSPCLVMQRRTWRGTREVTQVRQIFPADAHFLLARFGPGARTAMS